MDNPWLAGLDDLGDIDEIRRRAWVPGQAASLPDGVPIEQRTQALSQALASIYVPTDRGCRILTLLIGRMRAFLHDCYPDARTFLSTLYDGPAEDRGEAFLCLTGPAGVGKSALMAALERVLPAPRWLRLDVAHPEVRIDLVRRVQVKANISDSAVLRALANPAFASRRKVPKVSEAIEHLRRWFYTCGVATVVVDEMQFLTQSATANTRAAQLLLSLGYPGVPVTYIANYSLGHRLKARPQEERQRLLADHLVLRPDPPDAASWEALVAEYVKVAPDVLRLDPESHAWDLHRMTGGLPRLLGQLITTTFRYLAPANGGVVSIGALREIYRSRYFDTQRTDVEAMLSLSESTLLARGRKDLVCPFAGKDVAGDGLGYAENAADGASNTGGESPFHAVPLSAQHQLESTLSPAASATLEQLRRSGTTVAKKARKGATVTPIRRNSGSVEADLYAGIQALRDLNDKGKRRPPDPDDDA